MNPFKAWVSDTPMFIVWRGTDKSPVDPLRPDIRSNAQDRATWLQYDVAAEYARSLGAGYGVGVVLHDGCGLLCVDIDGCVDADRRLSPIALQLIRDARRHCPDCYVELSMSGRGVHIIGPYRGEPPPHSTKNQEHGIELYTTRRYIALTGVPCPPI